MSPTVLLVILGPLLKLFLLVRKSCLISLSRSGLDIIRGESFSRDRTPPPLTLLISEILLKWKHREHTSICLSTVVSEKSHHRLIIRTFVAFFSENHPGNG